MTARDKFLAVMAFEPGASVPKCEFGYWAGTIRRWLREGLPLREPLPPEALDGDLVRGSLPFGAGAGTTTRTGGSELVDHNVLPFLGLDSYLAKFPLDFSPRLAGSVLSEDARQKTFTDSYGLTVQVLKEHAATPRVLRYPIRSRRDLEDYLTLYDRDVAARLPAPLGLLRESLKNREYPIRLGGGPFGFTFLARSLMGEERFMTALYDEPGLVHRFNEFFLDFAMEYWAPILEATAIDCVILLEDIAYRNGPMISAEMFEAFALPYTARLVDFLRQYRVPGIVVDCDGLLGSLLPLWVRAGITGLFPLEAVNDIAAVRETFPRLQLLGGVDKRLLITGDRRAIDAELARVAPLLEGGGFIPHIDHAVPEDISWESFRYYRERLNDIIDGRRT
jgi:uroporphyrinogen-III decarboxylase